MVMGFTSGWRLCRAPATMMSPVRSGAWPTTPIPMPTRGTPTPLAASERSPRPTRCSATPIGASNMTAPAGWPARALTGPLRHPPRARRGRGLHRSLPHRLRPAARSCSSVRGQSLSQRQGSLLGQFRFDRARLGRRRRVRKKMSPPPYWRGCCPTSFEPRWRS